MQNYNGGVLGHASFSLLVVGDGEDLSIGAKNGDVPHFVCAHEMLVCVVHAARSTKYGYRTVRTYAETL